jgi:hypothetical protein
MRHLEEQGIKCDRSHSIAEIKGTVAPRPAITRAATPKALPKPRAKAAPKVPAPDRVGDVIENLRKRAKARPSTLPALKATIKSLFRATPIADGDVDRIADELKRRGVIAVRDDKVTYPKS